MGNPVDAVGPFLTVFHHDLDDWDGATWDICGFALGEPSPLQPCLAVAAFLLGEKQGRRF
jgi:hypothetical protein